QGTAHVVGGKLIDVQRCQLQVWTGPAMVIEALQNLGQDHVGMAVVTVFSRDGGNLFLHGLISNPANPLVAAVLAPLPKSQVTLASQPGIAPIIGSPLSEPRTLTT